MKRAEAIAAFVLAILSLYIMWKSTELPIGWRKDFGPGGGAFPFWLAVGMFVTSGLIFIKALRGQTPESQSTEPFMTPQTRKLFLKVTLALTLTVGLMEGVKLFGLWLLPPLGTYVALPLFLLFYVRHMGKHSWLVAISLALVVPVVTFVFFEKLLLILLPKGITDPLFYIFF